MAKLDTTYNITVTRWGVDFGERGLGLHRLPAFIRKPLALAALMVLTYAQAAIGGFLEGLRDGEDER